MILTIDVGNTDTVLAFYKDDKILRSHRVPTKPYKTEDEYISLFQEMKFGDVEGIIIALVVPDLRSGMSRACQKVFGIKPSFIGDREVEIDLKIKIDKPETLGADRIANSIAAIKKFKKNIIIVDFGTATNFEVIGEDNDFIGGVIAPGIKTSVKSLSESAALLPMYEVERPSKVIATSLEDTLHSGIFYGSLGMINFLIENIKEELLENSKLVSNVVSTGGLGDLFTKHTKLIDVYDEHLTTFGLLEIYKFNKNKNDI
ncbi:MAG: type III pantothenate kinase [Alphaproteobacteria bacterium]|nr:type III pantothenate kinase [Alphaproteobacteria bacterium]